MLFNPDTLRVQLFESSPSLSSSSPFISLCFAKPQLSLPSLAHLLESFTAALRKYRTTLFGAGDTGVGDVRTKAFGFFEAYEDAVEKVEKRGDEVDVVLAWRTRVEMLSVVERERLFMGGMDEAEVLLKKLVVKAVNVISISHEEIGKNHPRALTTMPHTHYLYRTHHRAAYGSPRNLMRHL